MQTCRAKAYRKIRTDKKRLGYILQEHAICILPVLSRSPENFVEHTELGERTNVTFLRKTSTSTCKLRKNLTESACLSERCKPNAVGREYSMCEKATQRWFSGKRSWQVLIQIVLSQAVFLSFAYLVTIVSLPAVVTL